MEQIINSVASDNYQKNRSPLDYRRVQTDPLSVSKTETEQESLFVSLVVYVYVFVQKRYCETAFIFLPAIFASLNV